MTGRAGALRTYGVPVLVAIGFLLVTPFTLLVVFLSGDSCCGEDTTGTMLGVTTGVLVVLWAPAWAMAAALADPEKRPGYRRAVACAVMAGPASLVHVAFVAYVSLTAF